MIKNLFKTPITDVKIIATGRRDEKAYKITFPEGQVIPTDERSLYKLCVETCNELLFEPKFQTYGRTVIYQGRTE